MTTKPVTKMVSGEVAWKTAKTFDIFQVLWDNGSKPLAAQRKDLNGMTYNQVLLRSAHIKRLQKKLLAVDPAAQIYLTIKK